MSRLLLPFTATVLLVIGCSQNAVAENGAADRQDDRQEDRQHDTQAASAPSARQAEPKAAASSSATASSGDSTPATCIFGDGEPTPCTMTSRATDGDGGVAISFRIGPDTIRFRGKRQDRWWSGTLNDKPAMAYELNRGHVVFNARDLDRAFEYWTKGNEHGSY